MPKNLSKAWETHQDQNIKHPNIEQHDKNLSKAWETNQDQNIKQPNLEQHDKNYHQDLSNIHKDQNLGQTDLNVNKPQSNLNQGAQFGGNEVAHDKNIQDDANKEYHRQEDYDFNSKDFQQSDLNIQKDKDLNTEKNFQHGEDTNLEEKHAGIQGFYDDVNKTRQGNPDNLSTQTQPSQGNENAINNYDKNIEQIMGADPEGKDKDYVKQNENIPSENIPKKVDTTSGQNVGKKGYKEDKQFDNLQKKQNEQQKEIL